MKRNKTTIVSLTGGLGNQLFQMSAVLFVAESTQVELTTRFGRPRANSDGLADLFQFNGVPGTKPQIKEQEGNLLPRKSVGYLLRSGIAPKAWERNRAIKAIAEIATSVITSLSLRAWRRVFASTEVGYEPRLSAAQQGRLLLGYFQSYRYATDPKVLDALRGITVAPYSPWLAELRDAAESEKPIILHVRLTDYLDQSFGLLPAAYFERALATLRSTGANGRIWIFSDDLDGALERLPVELTRDARLIIEPPNTPPAHTLEAMRFGSHYAIANSTFSWWGAFLSYGDAVVAYPDPWFIDGSVIRDLCPPHWIAINR
jgi:hypothetical protein